MSPDQEDMEQTIRNMFYENFERLRAESGHSLSPDVKEAALEQVLTYWRRLRQIAESITDTEVKLNLPNQKTPKGRRFCIEGVVDIVRETGRTTMYDIKTHEPEFIEANRDFYQKQLNVYAHIWQNLRGQSLDETAVISTPLPNAVREATEAGDPEGIRKAFESWDPVISFPFDSGKVEETVSEFADAVDAIEDGEFASPSPSRLHRREFRNETFGTRVCRNCDARFSCEAFRVFARAPRRKDAAGFGEYYQTIASEQEREAWRDAAAPLAPDAADAVRDL